jgi:hypothetical protein
MMTVVGSLGPVLCMLFDGIDDFQSDSADSGSDRQGVWLRGCVNPLENLDRLKQANIQTKLLVSFPDADFVLEGYSIYEVTLNGT